MRESINLRSFSVAAILAVLIVSSFGCKSALLNSRSYEFVGYRAALGKQIADGPLQLNECSVIYSINRPSLDLNLVISNRTSNPIRVDYSEDIGHGLNFTNLNNETTYSVDWPELGITFYWIGDHTDPDFRRSYVTIKANESRRLRRRIRGRDLQFLNWTEANPLLRKPPFWKPTYHHQLPPGDYIARYKFSYYLDQPATNPPSSHRLIALPSSATRIEGNLGTSLNPRSDTSTARAGGCHPSRDTPCDARR